jgi:hypothetical protein
MIAVRTFRADYGGEEVEVAQGERVVDDHELVARFPEHFAPEGHDGRHNGRVRDGRVLDRVADPGTPETAALVTAIRRNIATVEDTLREMGLDGELDFRPPADDGESLERDIERTLLATDPRLRREREEAAADMAQLDWIEGLRADTMAADREEISAWLTD